ncbi:MAG: hypothetical protein NTY94_13315 [Alphaproteobacteria bacterium]|nr:hypothetical protein [Alphaproteobacteria bacterium]
MHQQIHLPDHPAVLQSDSWQAPNIAPAYPERHRFLDFWSRETEGKPHSVRLH